MPPLKKFLLKFIGKKAEYRNESFDDSTKTINFIAQKLCNLNNDEIIKVFVYEIVIKTDYILQRGQQIDFSPEIKDI